MAAHLLARGRLAGAQDDRDRAGGRAVVDVDRQKAALIVMRIEERKLLVAVDDIHRVVDSLPPRRRGSSVTAAGGAE